MSNQPEFHVIHTDLYEAAQDLVTNVNNFVRWLGNIAPELEHHEATLLASAFIKALPEAIMDNPETAKQIQLAANDIKSARVCEKN